MDNKKLVENFQRARLEEWIGNFSEAERIYSDIEKSNEQFSNILKPTVKEHKKRVKSNRGEIYKSNEKEISANKERIYPVHELDKKIPIYDEEKLVTNIIKKSGSLFWKYSIIIISKLDNKLKFELRGFNPNGYIPKDLESIDFSENINWVIKEKKINNNEMLWYLLESKLFDLKIYLSIDRWGLLYGNGIIKESYMGDGFTEIHNLLTTFKIQFEEK